MCGLFGYSTKEGVKLNKAQREVRGKILSSLGLAMQERGTHSTGVAGVCKEHGWCMVKQAVSASQFVRSEGFKDFIKHSPRVVIGHTRYATVGAINDDNSHPFKEGSIIGAHNGHVSNWRQVYGEGEVDSQAIFQALNKHENEFAPALKELQGRFAITWFSEDTLDKLHLVVDGNPLSIVRVPEIQTYFWCSLQYALEAVVSSHFDLSKQTIWSPKIEMVYTIDGKHQITRTEIEFGKYVAPATSNYGSRWSSYSSQYDSKKSVWEKDDDLDDEAKEVEEYNQSFLLTDRSESFNISEVRNFSRVMDLEEDDMRTIMEDCGECGFCQKQIDTLNDTMYWHETQKMILCQGCGDELEEWEHYVALDGDDLLDIDSELYIIDNESQDKEGSSCVL